MQRLFEWIAWRKRMKIICCKMFNIWSSGMQLFLTMNANTLKRVSKIYSLCICLTHFSRDFRTSASTKRWSDFCKKLFFSLLGCITLRQKRRYIFKNHWQWLSETCLKQDAYLRTTGSDYERHASSKILANFQGSLMTISWDWLIWS